MHKVPIHSLRVPMAHLREHKKVFTKEKKNLSLLMSVSTSLTSDDLICVDFPDSPNQLWHLYTTIWLIMKSGISKHCVLSLAKNNPERINTILHKIFWHQYVLVPVQRLWLFSHFGYVCPVFQNIIDVNWNTIIFQEGL